MIKNIVLIGFMGSGKSHEGGLLAQKLGWRHLDSDEIIERREKMNIARIFKEKGESYFRTVESRVIKDLLLKPQVVLSFGGGAVCRKVNRHFIKRKGFVIWLRISPEVALVRTQKSRNRPLLEVKDRAQAIRDLMKEREPYYRQCANAIVNNNGGSALSKILRLPQIRKIKSGPIPIKKVTKHRALEPQA
jgi:shikimate kinase